MRDAVPVEEVEASGVFNDDVAHSVMEVENTAIPQGIIVMLGVFEANLSWEESQLTRFTIKRDPIVDNDRIRHMWVLHRNGDGAGFLRDTDGHFCLMKIRHECNDL